MPDWVSEKFAQEEIDFAFKECQPREDLAAIGDVQSCTEQLTALWEAAGGFGTLLMIEHDWDQCQRWQRSMDLLAQEVIPALPSL